MFGKIGAIVVNAAIMIAPEMSGWVIGDQVSDPIQRFRAWIQYNGKLQQIENAIIRELEECEELKTDIGKINQELGDAARSIVKNNKKIKDKKNRRKKRISTFLIMTIKEECWAEKFKKQLEKSEYFNSLSNERKTKVVAFFFAVAQVYLDTLGTDAEKLCAKIDKKIDKILRITEATYVMVKEIYEDRKQSKENLQ